MSWRQYQLPGDSAWVSEWRGQTQLWKKALCSLYEKMVWRGTKGNHMEEAKCGLSLMGQRGRHNLATKTTKEQSRSFGKIMDNNNFFSLGSSLLIQPTQISLHKKEGRHCTMWCFWVNWAVSVWSTSGLHFSPALWFWAHYFYLLCLSYLICQMGLFRVSIL